VGTIVALLILVAAGPALANGLDDLTAMPALRQHALQKERFDTIDRRLDGSLRRVLHGRRSAVPSNGLVPLDLAAEASGERGLLLRIALSSVDAATVRSLGRHGLDVLHTDEDAGVVEGYAGPGDLKGLASLPFVRSIRPVLRGRTRTGSVTTEGDGASGAPTVRADGYDGTGVSVGVISDGINNVAQSQATGDLSAVLVPADPRCTAGDGDEGTALLEIVHDLAPGASLMFSSGMTPGAFADSVRCLTDAGADVIVDDIGFFDEPFFADGPIATVVRAAVDAGVSFHSAAGNEGEEHYEADYRPSSSTSFHDFLGGPVDNTDDMYVAPFDTVLCVLEWDDAFGQSANDYDLYLLDADLNLVASSIELQTGTQDPLEIAGVVNSTASTQILKVVVDRYAGATRRLEMFCLGGANPQYPVPQGSIIGHPAVPEVIAVGAVDVLDPGLNDVEDFSSRGPARVAFPSTQVRPKPDLVAFDGVSISNAGGFPLCPPYCVFFGTSAAAPHSAAVAALLLSKNGTLSPGDVHSILTESAVDIGPAGFDDASGFGRINAAAAAELVLAPECSSDAECDDHSACTVDACNGGTCVHAAVSCSDGDACNGLETCDPSSGCAPGVPPTCDDGNVCNGTETCDSGSGCVSGEPLACDDDNACNGAETCDPVTGCVAGVPPTCSDDDECTTDTCDEVSGCVYTPIGGFEGADCELRRLTSVQLCEEPLDGTTWALVATKVSKARTALTKAATATKLRKERKFIKKTDHQLQRLQGKLGKLAHKGKLDPGCGAALVDAVADRRSMINALRL
jgi:hypothetical protein